MTALPKGHRIGSLWSVEEEPARSVLEILRRDRHPEHSVIDGESRCEQAEGEDRTVLTIWPEFPGMNGPLAERIAPHLERA